MQSQSPSHCRSTYYIYIVSNLFSLRPLPPPYWFSDAERNFHRCSQYYCTLILGIGNTLSTQSIKIIQPRHTASVPILIVFTAEPQPVLSIFPWWPPPEIYFISLPLVHPSVDSFFWEMSLRLSKRCTVAQCIQQYFVTRVYSAY